MSKGVDCNPVLAHKIDLRLQKDSQKIFDGIIMPGEYFDVTICNPPFHSSKEEAEDGTLRKLSSLKGTKVKKVQLNFGGSARIAGKDAKYVPLVEQEDYVIDKVLKINLYGAFWASRAAARVMIKQGEGGKIINFSSAVGLNGLATCCDYAASKGGVISLTKALAKEAHCLGMFS